MKSNSCSSALRKKNVKKCQEMCPDVHWMCIEEMLKYAEMLKLHVHKTLSPTPKSGFNLQLTWQGVD